MKINVIGTSGSGKSTLAKTLADKLDIPYIQMDQLFWQPRWQESSDEEFFSKLEAALVQHAWVLDGNYRRTNEIKWRDVDLIIWLNYSLSRTLYRAIKRAISRALSQEELWPGTGNRESFARLFSADSVVLHTLKTHRRNQKEIAAMMACKNLTHIERVEARTPQEASKVIERITGDAKTSHGFCPEAKKAVP